MPNVQESGALDKFRKRMDEQAKKSLLNVPQHPEPPFRVELSDEEVEQAIKIEKNRRDLKMIMAGKLTPREIVLMGLAGLLGALSTLAIKCM